MQRSKMKSLLAYKVFFFCVGFFGVLKFSVEPLEFVMSLNAHKSLEVSVPEMDPMTTRLVFVTILEPTWILEAMITRTAQALFPLKEDVIWVIVVPPERDFPEHLLVKRLRRFGVPWVILKAKLKGNRNARIIATAWALKEVPTDKGVIMFTRMKDTYDARLLKQVVTSTKKVSVWPVGLLKPFSSPIVQNGTILGHFLPSPIKKQHSIARGDILIEPGSFAVHLNYITKVEDWMKWIQIEENNPSWLVHDLEVSLNDITVVGPNFIGAWRSNLWELHSFPTDEKIKTFPTIIQSILSQVIR